MSDNRDYSLPADQEAITATVKALETNGFTVTVVDAAADAKKAVVELIPEGSEVFAATSETLRLSGLAEELNSSKYQPVRDKIAALGADPDKAIERRRLGSAMDYTVGSVHALTEDGRALVASGSGSQLPGYVYGANHVIWVVGSQKIVKDINEAFKRLETYTFPLEDVRAKAAYGSGSHIGKVLLYRLDPYKRVHIVLVKEAIGY